MKAICIRLINLFCYVCIPGLAFTQTKVNTFPHQNRFQYGAAIKAVIEFNLNSYKPQPTCRFAVDLGAASNWLYSWVYPSLNVEVNLYNGGLGSRNSEGFFHHLDVDIITALTMTVGTKPSFNRPYNVPLYYFSNNTLPALQNPFDASFSFGTNFITTLNTDKKNQRVGFMNGHYKNFQLSYYNDGGVPMSNTYLGDRKDRYYTGGGLVSYHGRNSNAINLVEITYQKYTGYTKNAFEASNILSLNNMNYHTPEQRRFNKSFWQLNLGNPSKGWSAAINNYNSVPWDLQHYIHWGLYNSYHLVPYKEYWSVSGAYFNSHTKIGIK